MDLQIQRPLPVQQVCCCEANCMGRPPVDLRQWPPLFVCRHNVLAFENTTRSRVAYILSVGEAFVLCLRGLVSSRPSVACVPTQDDPTKRALGRLSMEGRSPSSMVGFVYFCSGSCPNPPVAQSDGTSSLPRCRNISWESSRQVLR